MGCSCLVGMEFIWDDENILETVGGSWLHNTMNAPNATELYT